MAQLLRRHTSNASGVGSIPGRETKIPHACSAAKKLGEKNITGSPGGSDGEESACNAGDPGFILGWEDAL